MDKNELCWLEGPFRILVQKYNLISFRKNRTAQPVKTLTPLHMTLAFEWNWMLNVCHIIKKYNIEPLWCSGCSHRRWTHKWEYLRMGWGGTSQVKLILQSTESHCLSLHVRYCHRFELQRDSIYILHCFQTYCHHKDFNIVILTSHSFFLTNNWFNFLLEHPKETPTSSICCFGVWGLLQGVGGIAKHHQELSVWIFFFYLKELNRNWKIIRMFCWCSVSNSQWDKLYFINLHFFLFLIYYMLIIIAVEDYFWLGPGEFLIRYGVISQRLSVTEV